MQPLPNPTQLNLTTDPSLALRAERSARLRHRGRSTIVPATEDAAESIRSNSTAFIVDVARRCLGNRCALNHQITRATR
jgi:hypothetical protein